MVCSGRPFSISFAGEGFFSTTILTDNDFHRYGKNHLGL